MKVKKLVCLLLTLVFLFAAAACGEVENDSSDSGKKDRGSQGGVNVEMLLTADIAGSVTDEEAEAVKTVLEDRINYMGGTGGSVEYDREEGVFRVEFTAKGGKEAFETEEAAHRLCERGVLAFCRDEDPDDVIFTGTDGVKKATAAYDDAIDEYVVHLELTDEGAGKFAEATAELIGRKISIWMDDTMISAPTVQTAITGKEAVITGMDSAGDAEKFADRINGGALPFNLTCIENGIKIGR